MILDDKTRSLASQCTKDIKSFSKKEEILKYLPIEHDNFKIFFAENKLMFYFDDKVSYVYLENDYFSNIGIMKRLGIILGIELKREDIFSITKFCLNINQILSKGEI